MLAAARNLAIKHFRHTGGEVLAEELTEELRVPEGADPLRRLLDEELSSEVQRAVESLPPLQREALVLFEFEELSLAEVAEVVGADIGAVKARLHRARQRLKVVLAPYMNSSSSPQAAVVEEAFNER